MSSSPSIPSAVAPDSLRRRVALYRALSLLLAVSLLAVLVAVKRAMTVPEDPEVEVFDVPAVFERLAAKDPEAADVSDTFFFADGSTVHLHVMGRGQACPLHIHRRTHEATVIVAGKAEVQQRWGEGGTTLQERRGTHLPGELIASAPFTGHAWFNRDSERMLGNLVFAAPRFDGNLYVDADDPRMARGRAPFTFDPVQALAELEASGRDVSLVPFPVMETARMGAIVLEKGEHLVEASREQPLILYVARGSGVVALDDTRPMKEGQLWVLRRRGTVRPDEGASLVLYLFVPPLAPPAEVARGG
ncbi:hypothetical protein LZ198_13865 [Myxococcus sp. K15C18031901]|uniref:hypothetical protein n=1 Tax=Myxococcus dinghuensis TaxID=2906761 RepID=UPI0020A79373|nr:hypothetical protein [Myxococcus dinghuensis]MCP3099957.1 hypothetical protein [Myxococcus dinghuensis]